MASSFSAVWLHAFACAGYNLCLPIPEGPNTCVGPMKFYARQMTAGFSTLQR